MRQVLTYRVPGDLTWKESVFQKEYADVMHIVATPTLLESLSEGCWWIKAPIVTIGSVLEGIFGKGWSSPRAQMKQFLAVSSALEELWGESVSTSERKLIFSFKKNRKEIIYTLRILCELRLMDSIESGTEEEELLVKLWGKVKDQFELRDWEAVLLKKEGAFEKVLVDIFKDMGTPSELEKHNIFDEAFQSDRSVVKSLQKKKLILHGFYFITPIQEYLFKILEEKYELVFLNLYNEDYPATFRIVEEFLQKGKWTWQPSFNEPGYRIHPLAASLLLGFEGEEVSARKKDVTVHRFTDLTEFIRKEKSRREASDKPFEHVVTSRGGQAREQLYYSDLLVKKNHSLLEYPIGRFLFTLHGIIHEKKNPEDGESRYYEAVTPESMKTLFSSGYLVYKNPENGQTINMKSYLKELEMLLPYFSLGDGYIQGKEKNEPAIEEWIVKIDEIIEEKLSWNQEGIPDSRVHRLHSRPFEQLSYFKLGIEDLNVVKKGFLAVKEMGEDLFGSQSELNITGYIKKLKKYTEAPLDAEIIREEKEVIHGLLKQMDELTEDELTFRVSDISQGLRYFLTSGLPSEKDDESEKIDRLGGLYLGDGIPFKSNRDIHLAFADHKSLPSIVKYKLWPLSSKTEERLIEHRPELGLFRVHSRFAGSMNRYLLYAMFSSADNVRISFVEDLNEETGLRLAAYFKMIGLEGETTSVKADKHKANLIEAVAPSMDFSNWSEMMEEEWKLCKKRAIFSYILNDYSSFQEDFHQRNIFSGLLWEAHNVFGDWENAYNSIEALFPQYSSEYKKFVKKQNMKKKNRRYKIKYHKVEDYEYATVVRTSRLLGMLKENDDTSEQKGSIASPGYNCRFCPHLNICAEGVYPKDGR
ncbi:hypothetical protein [Planococcus maitriensis]|uniref:PD-(D/E)XK endonuclease-like domain-containing protein n=1 Tax=Planococcus maitriensis TaxID=221799 RepID=A0A365K8S0_9BACL|nr:hypothetical protein [Planococcus maitriensis]RAZ69175.1 hypothetical protein DP119_00485 [Planococcus maitriensis]